MFTANAALAAEGTFEPPKSEPPKPEVLTSEKPKLGLTRPGLSKSGPSMVKTHIPTLVETVRFSGDIRLCGEKIPFTDPEVRERLEKEMMLAVWNRPQVMLWLKRAHRWFPHIEKVLREEKLPLDLKYLPLWRVRSSPMGNPLKVRSDTGSLLRAQVKDMDCALIQKSTNAGICSRPQGLPAAILKKLYSQFKFIPAGHVRI